MDEHESDVDLKAVENAANELSVFPDAGDELTAPVGGSLIPEEPEPGDEVPLDDDPAEP